MWMRKMGQVQTKGFKFQRGEQQKQEKWTGHKWEL
jgi:hypothetical protein